MCVPVCGAARATASATALAPLRRCRCRKVFELQAEHGGHAQLLQQPLLRARARPGTPGVEPLRVRGAAVHEAYFAGKVEPLPELDVAGPRSKHVRERVVRLVRCRRRAHERAERVRAQLDLQAAGAATATFTVWPLVPVPVPMPVPLPVPVPMPVPVPVPVPMPVSVPVPVPMPVSVPVLVAHSWPRVRRVRVEEKAHGGKPRVQATVVRLPLRGHAVRDGHGAPVEVGRARHVPDGARLVLERVARLPSTVPDSPEIPCDLFQRERKTALQKPQRLVQRIHVVNNAERLRAAERACLALRVVFLGRAARLAPRHHLLRVVGLVAKRYHHVLVHVAVEIPVQLRAQPRQVHAEIHRGPSGAGLVCAPGMAHGFAVRSRHSARGAACAKHSV